MFINIMHSQSIENCTRKKHWNHFFLLKSLKYYKFANRQSADFSVFRNLHLYAFLHTIPLKENLGIIKNKTQINQNAFNHTHKTN